MSLEQAFVSIRSAVTLSVAPRRRLRLLQAVLPHFSRAAAQMYYAARPFSTARAFWTQFLSLCLPMELGGWNFERLDDRHDGPLQRSLQCLELVACMEKSDIYEEFISSPFPRLETLRKDFHQFDEEVTRSKIMKITKPTTPQVCSDLLRSLKEIADAMDDHSIQPPPEEPDVTTKSKPILAPMLPNLFSTLSNYFKCACFRPHKAILLLFTHRSMPEEGLHSFTMLLTRGKAANRWMETVVTVKEQMPEPQVHITLPGSMDQQPTLTPVPNLCESINNNARTRLELSIERGALFQRLGFSQEHELLSEGDPVSLSDGFFGNETELDINGKICLAVVLSYSLLDFCGEPWFPIGWTRNGICLFQSHHLKLRPMLVTCVRPGPGDSTGPPIPFNLKLLFHGILLMEIFLQAPLSIDLSPGKGFKTQDLRGAALAEFEAINWSVCERFRQAVETCLQGLDVAHSPVEDEELLAKAFCQRVISPLETDFASLWGKRDPDEVMSGIKLPSVPIERKKPPPLVPKPAHFQICKQKPGIPTSAVASAPLRLFDTVDSPDAKQIAGAQGWFDLLDREHVQGQLPKRAEDKDNRIKIAVLDTGINLDNPWIQQKAGRVQCWPNEKDCEDTDGHGTQVAYLLLRMTPHTHIRIAKVSKSRLLRDADIENIAKAIRHFSTDFYDRVDIINLSFGFPQFHERLRPILTAIREARQNNVLIFAAAGNDGGNKGIFWPAKLHETGDVICINASDSDGNASSFNPTVGSNNRLCTLGEGIPSCEKDAEGQMIHRSGTSFATPIAVAIAAIVLGFVDNIAIGPRIPGDLIDLRRRLLTKSGMERVLHTTCVLTEEKRRAGYSYITPWFFLEIEENARVGIKANELRSIPE